MARPRWRQRSDGISQIGRQGRLRRALLALATIATALAMAVAALSATAVYVVVGLPFAVAGAVLLILRSIQRRSSRAAAPAATVLSLDRRSAAGHARARDAGA